MPKARLAMVAAVAVLASPFLAGPALAAPAGASGRFIVVARTAADYAALRDTAVRGGAKLIREIPQIRTFVVSGSGAVRTNLRGDRRTRGLSTDRVRTVTTADRTAPNTSKPGLKGATRVDLARTNAAAKRVRTDPGFDYAGLQWDLNRIGLPKGWQTTLGSPRVTVAVADTGIDFTHAELAPRVTRVVDLTEPGLCDVTDAELAAANPGSPVTTDWHGHGSWIAGNIAATLDGAGINGIAPKVNLVSLKISENCGSANDSSLLAAFATAADLGIDVVNISFGGYLDRADPEQELIYQAYVEVVAYARAHGTAIVASAGNEHVRVGAGGRVLSNGSLNAPGAALVDLHGLYETPGGTPGVVNVAATNNVVNRPSASCPGDTGGSAANPNATCKPISDPHQAGGIGKTNQLAYYSNYGPRIDIAAPGGARKFNLPLSDRGGTPGFPYTDADLTNVWQDFSTTSNWATGIPCFVFAAGSGFPENQCYSSIQGTSMAAPHVAAAIALVASAHPNLRHNPVALINRVRNKASDATNYTQPLSATDKSVGDMNGLACPTGYCHLGGPRIPNSEAYGAGIVNVSNP